MTKISSADSSALIATSTSESLSAFQRCAKPAIAAATGDLLLMICMQQGQCSRAPAGQTKPTNVYLQLPR
jgi:hypothetical protein